ALSGREGSWGNVPRALPSAMMLEPFRLRTDQSLKVSTERQECQPYFTITTPHGLPPAFTRLISFSVARSTTDTSSDGPFAANKNFPSGEIAMPHGRGPTLIAPSTSSVAASSTHTVPARPVLT